MVSPRHIALLDLHSNLREAPGRSMGEHGGAWRSVAEHVGAIPGADSCVGKNPSLKRLKQLKRPTENLPTPNPNTCWSFRQQPSSKKISTSIIKRLNCAPPENQMEPGSEKNNIEAAHPKVKALNMKHDERSLYPPSREYACVPYRHVIKLLQASF